MKKKIAIFANGWSNEYLELVLEGVKKRASEANIDLFVFANYSAGSPDDPENIGQGCIFKLPDVKEFDGALLMGNTINMAWEREFVRKQIEKYNIPAISLEYEIEGIPCIETDTYDGVYKLILHVLEKHHAQDFLYVSGPIGNLEDQKRRKALEDALETRGLVLKAEAVIVAEWSYFLAYDKMIEYAATHDKMPDAIVCANDEMAIAVCAALDYMGIGVPQDVIVTGCDNLVKGQSFYPILSTVGREWEQLGYRGMEALFKRMMGAEVEPRTLYHSVPVIGESCGCHVKAAKSLKRLRAITGNYRLQREDMVNEWQLRYIDEVFSQKKSVEELKATMRKNFQDNSYFEGSDWLLCIVEGYFDEKERVEELPPGELSARMDVYVNLVDGKAIPTERFETKKMIPYYDGNTDESHVFLFVPLYIKERTIGYVVQKDNLKKLYEQSIYIWLRRLSQDMERVKQNIRVEELNKKLKEVSITDALTGLRNRTGFDALALPYLQKCHEMGMNSAIVFADINCMKVINDKYGHLQGDLAICTVAEAIKRTLPENWIAVRYGGDEFLMVGDCKDMEEAESIRKKLGEELQDLIKRRQLIFDLSVSLGAVVMHPSEKYSLEEYLKKADDAMYAAKQQYHSKKVED